MRQIKWIILHCSDTPEGRDVRAETIKGWHVNERGWSDIGYHYVIELDGSIIEGRKEERNGAHAAGYNSNSIGVCYVGGKTKDMKMPKDTRTEDQIISMFWLLKNLKDKYPEVQIIGHNNISTKDCPSFDVEKWVKDVRLDK